MLRMVFASVVLTSLMLPPAIRAEVRASYDKFTGLYSISSAAPLPRITPQLQVVATFRSYDFENRPFQPTIMLRLTLEGASWRFLECHTLYWLADGKRVDLPQPEHDGTVGEGYVIEDLSVSVPSIELLQQLASATKIEYKLCGGVYELTPAELKDLRELYAKLTTPTG